MQGQRGSAGVMGGHGRDGVTVCIHLFLGNYWPVQAACFPSETLCCQHKLFLFVFLSSLDTFMLSKSAMLLTPPASCVYASIIMFFTGNDW